MAKTVKIKHIQGKKQSIADVGTQLQVQIEGIPSRFKTTLIGMDPGNCLLVKTPDIVAGETRENVFNAGNHIIVRYLYNGSVLGFQSKLIDAISSPMKLLFIEYPGSVENFDLRAKTRIQCFLPAKSKILDEATSGVILDISEGGCRYQVKAFNGQKLPEINIDNTIKLFCRFPGLSGEYEILGKVRNVTPDNQKKVLGVQFTEFVDPQAGDIVKDYVASAKASL